MKIENLDALKIHTLSKEQFNREKDAGRLDATALYLTPAEAAGVASVNGKTGDITLSASDVGAAPANTAFQRKLGNLTSAVDFNTIIEKGIYWVNTWTGDNTGANFPNGKDTGWLVVYGESADGYTIVQTFYSSYNQAVYQRTFINDGREIPDWRRIDNSLSNNGCISDYTTVLEAAMSLPKAGGSFFAVGGNSLISAADSAFPNEEVTYLMLTDETLGAARRTIIAYPYGSGKSIKYRTIWDGSWQTDWKYITSPEEIGAVPTSRTVNGKALSSDITLSADNVGALPNNRTMSDTDLNSLTTAGKYDITYTNASGLSSYHLPFDSGATWAIVLVLCDGTQRVTQILSLPYSHQKTMYVRYKHDDDWSEWARIYDTKHKPTPNEIGAVNKTGDTMSGALFVQKDTAVEANIGAQGPNGKIALQVATNRGLWDFDKNAWVLRAGKGSTDWHLYGTADNVTGTVAIANGGTGATTADAARANLGAAIGNGIIPGGTDLNTITASGMYRLNGSGFINAPSAANYSQLLVIHGGSDTITQIIGDYSGGDLWTRSGNPSDVGGSGNWTEWAMVYDTAHKPTPIEIGALPKVMTENTHYGATLPSSGAVGEVFFKTGINPTELGALPSTGGTMSGNITMNNNKITGLAVPTSASEPLTAAFTNSFFGEIRFDTNTTFDIPLSGRGMTLIGLTANGATNGDKVCLYCVANNNGSVVFQQKIAGNFTGVSFEEVTKDGKGYLRMHCSTNWSYGFYYTTGPALS